MNAFEWLTAQSNDARAAFQAAGYPIAMLIIVIIAAKAKFAIGTTLIVICAAGIFIWGLSHPEAIASIFGNTIQNHQ